MKRGVIDGCIVCETTWEELRKARITLLVRCGVGICKGCLLHLAMDCSRGAGLSILFRDGDAVRLIEGGGSIRVRKDGLRDIVHRVFIVQEQKEQEPLPIDPAQEQAIEESKFGPGGLGLGRPHIAP